MEKVHDVVDRVHSLGSWVYDIVDQSWPLVLIRAAKILWDRRGILDLIWALDLTTDGSGRRMTDSGGAASARGGSSPALGAPGALELSFW
jgi:hypothetical protein